MRELTFNEVGIVSGGCDPWYQPITDYAGFGAAFGGASGAAYGSSQGGNSAMAQSAGIGAARFGALGFAYGLGNVAGTALYDNVLSQSDTFNDYSYAFFDFFLGD